MGALVVALSTGDAFLIAVIVAVPFAILSFVLGAKGALGEIGKGPLSIEQEMPQSEGGSSAPASGEVREAEVRQLVVARNERRARKGEEPLDVDAEVERQLRELENLGQ